MRILLIAVVVVAAVGVLGLHLVLLGSHVGTATFRRGPRLGAGSDPGGGRGGESGASRRSIPWSG
jgi:hypothetical protein